MSDDVAKTDLDFRDKEALEAWLRTQPREVSIIIAARAALRVLPVAAEELSAKDTGLFAALISAMFRATALARVAAKYPARANKLAALAVAAHSAAYTFTAITPMDRAAAAASFAAGAAGDAAFAVRSAGTAAASAAVAVTDSSQVWAALSSDARFLAAGGAAAELADCPLWQDRTPPWARELWAKIMVALPFGEEWEVWTDWYEQRSVGGVPFTVSLYASSRVESYELVFATVPVEVWGKGPAAANRWIKEHLPKEPSSAVKPLENIPSPFTFGFSASRKITVVAGPQNLPVFPFAGSEPDHRQWLETCHTLTDRLLNDLRGGRFNPRSDYRESLEQVQGRSAHGAGAGQFHAGRA